jgi:hypothetical protein
MPDMDLDPKLTTKQDKDPKKTISDPKYCTEEKESATELQGLQFTQCPNNKADRFQYCQLTKTQNPIVRRSKV